MHKLDRSSVPVPECLEVARREGRTYKQLRTRELREIRTRLLEMQQERCAYCERRTDGHPKHGGHIEHFRQQSPNHPTGDPTLDLSWPNLFWSCVDPFTCGKHKDNCNKQSGRKKACEPGALLDPGRDDPEDYLLFISDGTVEPRDRLDDAARIRAEETLRVFQLAESAFLRKSREDAVQPYIDAVTAMTEFGPEAFDRYVRTALERAGTRPFGTAIKHFLESVI